jgi:CubicO group peptidase (beta-lactamase class C family)
MTISPRVRSSASFPIAWSAAFPLKSHRPPPLVPETMAEAHRRFFRGLAARKAWLRDAPTSAAMNTPRSPTIVRHRGAHTAQLQPRRPDPARKLPPDLLRKLATILVDVGSSPLQPADEDLTEADEDGSLGSRSQSGPLVTWPTTVDEMERLLVQSGCDEPPVINPNPEPPRLQLRAFVPTSHGNGFRYDWKMSGPIDGVDLFDRLEDERADGWRAYLITLSATTRTGFEPRYDILFVRDDDSNFNTGVDFFPHEELDLAQDAMRAKGRRPLSIVHSEFHEDHGFYAATWIEDNKYQLPDEWKIVRHSFDNLKAESEVERDAGFRPISATFSHPSCTVIYVKDFDVDWVLCAFSASIKSHPVSVLHASEADSDQLVPISLDGKAEPGSNGHGPITWVVVATIDPDLDSVAQPFVKWKATKTSFGFPSSPPSGVAQKKASRRIHAFASVSQANPLVGFQNGSLYFLIDAEAPTLHCRTIYNEDTTDPLFRFIPVGMGPFFISDMIDITVNLYMQTYGVHTLTLGIYDPVADPPALPAPGWRFRAGYTLAPLAYPDTFPETRFRIGSVSKLVTALTTWTALELNGLDETMKVFQPLPARWAASVVDAANANVDEGYPAVVLDVEVGHILTHRTGWDDDLVHPGGKEDPLWAEAVAAGLPAEFSGWRNALNEGLLPLVRDDYLLYMLRREAFTQVPGTLEQRVGYRKNVLVFPFISDNYSGFAYDLLGTAIEYLQGQENLSHPGSDFAGLVSWTGVNVLGPLGMTHTIPGRTPRMWNHDAEAIYRVDRYIEQTSGPTPQGKDIFKPTRLYSPSAWSTPQEVVDPEVAYNDSLSPLPSTLSTPRYVIEPYGGYRLESALPRGGWVSTAPDLCRMMRVFSMFIGSPLGFQVATLGKIRADPGANAYNLGGLKRAYASFLEKRGSSSDASVAAASFDAASERILCWCRAEASASKPSNFTTLIAGMLDGFGV